MPRELLCFQLDKNEPVSTVFRASFHGYEIEAKATRGWRNTWEGAGQETPGFASIVKMDEDDFVVIGKTMSVEIFRSGYKLKNLMSGHFRSSEWVGDLPLTTLDDQKVLISLTEKPRAIDHYRVKFAKQWSARKPGF